MSTKSVTVKAGPGPFFLLFLVFLVLKLTEVITWSWLWVTAPLWIPLGFVAVLLMVAGVLVGVGTLLEKRVK